MRSLLVLCALFALAGCTENQQARTWGGTMTVELPCGEMLFDLTWKNDNFWYATQPMPEGYELRTTTFHEKKDGMSLIADGTVIIKEYRP